MRPVSIVVLAWNRWELTARTLATLRETDLDGAEVLVVDNGSTDATPAELERLGWVRTLRLPENCGYVRGNNAGIAACDPRHDVVLVNNDVQFPRHDWLQRLRACAAERSDVGVVGCRLVLPDGRLLHAGTYVLPETGVGQQIGSLEMDLGQYTSTREVQGVVFACALLRRELLTAIGGLATEYDTYAEDSDYCLRARDVGFRTVVCGEVTLVHDEHGSTSLEPRRRESLLASGREVFRRRWRSRLEEDYDQELLWVSMLHPGNGWGVATRGILPALERLGVRTVYRYAYGPGTVFPPPEADDSGDYLLNVVKARRPRDPGLSSVVFGQPHAFSRHGDGYRIGFTMLEVDGFPADWVHMAEAMDEVWVPSAFNRDAFLASGLTRPLRVMPLGVDTDHFHPGIRGFRDPQGDFVFLSCFEWGERRAPELLLQTFNRCFAASDPVRLVCKISNTDAQRSMRREILALGLRPEGGRISYLFNRNLPHYQLAALYRSADCFVSTSRGEGWNLPLMEAMACGLPAIATDWGGHREFVREDIAYPLRVRAEIPAVARCPYYEGFSWADPDADHLHALLREVSAHPEEAARRGALAARRIARDWSWARVAARIRDRLAEIGHDVGRDVATGTSR